MQAEGYLRVHPRPFKSNAPELKDIPTLNAIVASANRPYKIAGPIFPEGRGRRKGG
jgi:hypothetical protein